jgi:tetratricopeptide (TPR) repeat protein
MRAIGLLALAAMLAGCETPAMTKKECLAGDWYAAGLEDGLGGLRETNFDARAAACYEYDAMADLSAYRDGRAEGLFRFCTPGGGYEYGRAGKSYLGVCLAEDEPGFLGAYLEGWRVHRAEEERRRAASAYDSAVYTIEAYRDDIRRARRVLSDKEATEKEIKKARKSLDNARDSLPYAERRADELLYELGRADEALERTLGSLEGWRRSREFEAARATLLEAQQIARGEDAINFCTDDASDGFNRPECEIRSGAAVRDRSGERLCASGPAKAVMLRRGDAYGPHADAAFVQVYQVFNRDEQGRTARRPDNQFVALFDAEGAYLGAACSPFDAAP